MEASFRKSASLLRTDPMKGKGTKKKTGKKQGAEKEKADGDKPRKPKKSVVEKNQLVVPRYLQYQQQHNFTGSLRKYRSPYENRVVHPFITGSGRSHNIGIKLQEMEKAKRREDPLLPTIRDTKRTRAMFTPVKTRYKGWIEPPRAPEWTKKVKEMFVVLHNEYSSLLEAQSELKKAKDCDEKSNKLAELCKKLENKELQVQVALKIYNENQKLRDEVLWLRKNIRPRRRKVRKPSQNKPALNPKGEDRPPNQ